MTSSFTGMLLAAGSRCAVLPADGARIGRLAAFGCAVSTDGLPLFASLVRARFERVVFLGSQRAEGLAREAALKMLELTDGRVVSLGETPLGVPSWTQDHHQRQHPGRGVPQQRCVRGRYDLDLLNELRRDASPGASSHSPDARTWSCATS